MPRFRKSISLHTLIAACVFLVSPSALLAGDNLESLRTVESKLQALYKAASPAIVRFLRDEPGEHPLYNNIGVIVSADGYVATIATQDLARLHKEGRSFLCLLPDGRRAKCVALGWSDEWRIALCKITDPGPWPHVEISRDADLAAGQNCAALSYAPQAETRLREEFPQLRLGNITQSARQAWFTISCKVDGWGPVLSLDGRLIGMTTYRPVGKDVYCTSAVVFTRFWKPLTEGKNLDAELLQASPQHEPSPAQTPPQNVEAVVADKPVMQNAEKAAAATVRIRRENQTSGGWSGVIVSRDGLVATCAHHFRLPGDKVTVQLADGRDLAGIVLGVRPISDICLVKITAKGDWPHVEMGSSVGSAAGDPCWLIGFPAERKERTPLVRTSRLVQPDDRPWSCKIYIADGAQIHGGDSGGGAFDSQGRLIGILQGSTGGKVETAYYNRGELFRKDWEFLNASQAVQTISGAPLDEFVEPFSQNAQPFAKCVVEILGDDKPVALGTVVGKDGQVLTKASELYGVISVRTPDGKSFPATLKKYSRAHDLALLTIATDDLTVANLKDADRQDSASLSPGRLVAALVPGGKPHVGVIAYKPRAIQTLRGAGLCDLNDTDRGLTVVDDSTARRLGVLIRQGDIIRKIEGHDTPDLKSELALLGDGNRAGSLLIHVGDPITVTVEREQATIKLRFPAPPAEWSLSPLNSHRCAGFPEVYDSDVSLSTKLCGGPLIDLNGRLIGITIAARGNDFDSTRVHVLPITVIERFLAD